MKSFFWGSSAFYFIGQLSLAAPVPTNVIPEHKHKVLHIIGDPAVTKIETNTQVPLKKDQTLDFDFSIKTNSSQILKLSLNNVWELVVLPDTEMSIDNSIERSYVQPDEIVLTKGKIYLRSIYLSEGDGFYIEFNLKSPLMQQKIESTQSIDTLFEFDSSAPAMIFCNRSQDYVAALFQHEEKVQLKTLEKVRFLGAFEPDSKNIAFDYLLNGRKIPKGQWEKKSSCDFKWIQDLESKIIKDLALQQKKKSDLVVSKKREKQKKDDSFLCHLPYGQLNQCHWKKTKEGCQRKRCNAEGKWTDLQLLNIKNCTQSEAVSDCNY